MSVSISSVPSNPVVTKGAKLSFLLSGGGNFVRLWCADAPVGSSLKTALENTGLTRIEIFANEFISSTPPFVFQPDKPGRYVLVAQEYQRGASSYGGGYSGDPRGFNSETQIGVEASLTLDFGTRVTTTLGVSPDTATLAMFVFGDDVLATTFELHGEKTPTIIDAKTPKARNVASQLQFSAHALSDSPNNVAATLLGSPGSIVSNMANQIAGHVTNTSGGVHATGSDTGNTPSAAYSQLGATTDNATIIKAVGELVLKLGYHLSTDKALKTPFTASGAGSGDWHTHSATVVVDGTNTLLMKAPTTIEDAYRTLADMWRAYEAHRVNLDVHGAADSTYTLNLLPGLCDLLRAFFAGLAKATPTVAPNENPGAALLISGAGMKES